MKKICFIFLFSLLFYGCEYYVQETNPQLNINGGWTIIDIIEYYSEDILTVNQDFFAISPFDVISINNNHWLIRNDTTGIEPCYFYKIGYRWEFDYNNLYIKNDRGKFLGSYYVGFIGQYAPNYFILNSKINGNQMGGVWEFIPNYTIGTYPANSLFIKVPEFKFNLDGPERSFDRLISQEIILVLMK